MISMKTFMTALILSSITTIASAGGFAPWDDRMTETGSAAAAAAGSAEPLVTSAFAPWPTRVAGPEQVDSTQDSAMSSGSAFQPWLR